MSTTANTPQPDPNKPLTSNDVTDQLNHGKGVPNKGRVADALLETVTAGYTSTQWNKLGWTMDSWSSYQFWLDVEDMLTHSSVFTPLALAQAPTRVAEHDVQASDKIVEAFCRSQLQTFWENSIRQVMESSDPYGWCGGEVVYQNHGKYMAFDKVRVAAPRDVVPLLVNNEMVGVLQRNVPGGEVRMWTGADKVPSKGFWHAHRPRFGYHYGRSILKPAWRDWKRLAGRTNLEETSDLAVAREGLGYTVIKYPDKIAKNMDGEEVHARDIALELGETMRSGADIVVPSTVYPDGSTPQWSVEFTHPESKMTELSDREDKLRSRIAEAIGVLSELKEAAETGSGFSGRMIPLIMFLQSRQDHAVELTTTFVEKVLKPLVYWNFGKKAWVKVQVRSLLETFQKLFAAKPTTAATNMNGEQVGTQPPLPQNADTSGEDDPNSAQAFNVNKPKPEQVLAAITVAQQEAQRLGNPHANDEEINVLKSLLHGGGQPTGPDGYVGTVSRAQKLKAVGVGKNAGQKLYGRTAGHTLAQQNPAAVKSALGGVVDAELADITAVFGWTAEQTREGHIKAVGTGEHAGRVLYGAEAQRALAGYKAIANPQQEQNPTRGTPPKPRGGGSRAQAKNAYDVLGKLHANKPVTLDDVGTFVKHCKAMSPTELESVHAVLVDRLGGQAKHDFAVKQLRNLAEQIMQQRGISPKQAGQPSGATTTPRQQTPPPLPKQATTQPKPTSDAFADFQPTGQTPVEQLQGKTSTPKQNVTQFPTPAKVTDKPDAVPTLEEASPSEIAEDRYQKLRLGNYRKPGSPHDPQGVEKAAMAAADIRRFPHPDWHFRFGKGYDPKKPVVHRASLNVHGHPELVQKLDEFAKKHGVAYKTPTSNEDWQGRHDPVTVYSHKEFTPEQQTELAKLAEPYARGDDGLLGQKIGKGVALQKEPQQADIEATMQRIHNANPQAAQSLLDWLGGKPKASAGQYHVLQQMAEKYAPKQEPRTNDALDDAFSKPAEPLTRPQAKPGDLRPNDALDEAFNEPTATPVPKATPQPAPQASAKPAPTPIPTPATPKPAPTAPVASPPPAKKQSVHPDLAKMDAYNDADSRFHGDLRDVHNDHRDKTAKQLHKLASKQDQDVEEAKNISPLEHAYQQHKANLLWEMHGKARRDELKEKLAKETPKKPTPTPSAPPKAPEPTVFDQPKDNSEGKVAIPGDVASEMKPQATPTPPSKPKAPQLVHPHLAKLASYNESPDEHKDHLRGVHANNFRRPAKALQKSIDKQYVAVARSIEGNHPDQGKQKAALRLLEELHGHAHRDEQKAALAKLKSKVQAKTPTDSTAPLLTEDEAEKAKRQEAAMKRIERFRQKAPQRDPQDKLRYLIRQRGGISPSDYKKNFGDLADLKENGLQSLIRHDAKHSLDQHAQALEESGHLRTPESKHATDHLIEQLQKDANHEKGTNSAEHEMEHAYHQHLLNQYEEQRDKFHQELEEARDGDTDESEIAEALRSAQGDGKTEALASLPPDASEQDGPNDADYEDGDEWDRDGGGDQPGGSGPSSGGLEDDFNFGANETPAANSDTTDEGDNPFTPDIPGVRDTSESDSLEQPEEQTPPTETPSAPAPEAQQEEPAAVTPPTSASVQAVQPQRVPVNDPSLDAPLAKPKQPHEMTAHEALKAGVPYGDWHGSVEDAFRHEVTPEDDPIYHSLAEHTPQMQDTYQRAQKHLGKQVVNKYGEEHTLTDVAPDLSHVELTDKNGDKSKHFMSDVSSVEDYIQSYVDKAKDGSLHPASAARVSPYIAKDIVDNNGNLFRKLHELGVNPMSMGGKVLRDAVANAIEKTKTERSAPSPERQRAMEKAKPKTTPPTDADQRDAWEQAHQRQRNNEGFDADAQRREQQASQQDADERAAKPRNPWGQGWNDPHADDIYAGANQSVTGDRSEDEPPTVEEVRANREYAEKRNAKVQPPTYPLPTPEEAQEMDEERQRKKVAEQGGTQKASANSKEDFNLNIPAANSDHWGEVIANNVKDARNITRDEWRKIDPVYQHLLSGDEPELDNALSVAKRIHRERGSIKEGPGENSRAAKRDQKTYDAFIGIGSPKKTGQPNANPVPPTPTTSPEPQAQTGETNPTATGATTEEGKKGSLKGIAKEQFDDYKPILERDVGKEVNARRKAMAASNVLHGLHQDAKQALVDHLRTHDPEAYRGIHEHNQRNPVQAMGKTSELPAEEGAAKKSFSVERDNEGNVRGTATLPSGEVVKGKWRADAGQTDEQLKHKMVLDHFGRLDADHATKRHSSRSEALDALDQVHARKNELLDHLTGNKSKEVLAQFNQADGHDRHYRVVPKFSEFNGLHHQLVYDVPGRNIFNQEVGPEKHPTHESAAKELGKHLHQLRGRVDEIQINHPQTQQAHDEVKAKQQAELEKNEAERKQAEELDQKNQEAKGDFEQQLKLGKGKKATHQIAGNEVSGTEYGPFFVHKKGNGYAVTHLKSKLGAASDLTREEAIQLAHVLPLKGNWDFSTSKEADQETMQHGFRAAKAFKTDNHQEKLAILNEAKETGKPTAEPTPEVAKHTIKNLSTLPQDDPDLTKRLIGAPLSAKLVFAQARKVGTNGLQLTDRRVDKDADEVLALKYEDDGATFERSIYRKKDGSFAILNHEVQIPKTSKHAGQFAKLLAEQVKAAYATGIKNLTAVGSGANDESGYNGHYTLPRAGYEGGISAEQFENLPPQIQQALGKSRSLRKLFDEIPGGKEAWKQHGDDVEIDFDTHPDSASSQALNRYLAERENKSKTPPKKTKDERDLERLEQQRVDLNKQGANSRSSIVSKQRRRADLDERIMRLRAKVKQTKEQPATEPVATPRATPKPRIEQDAAHWQQAAENLRQAGKRPVGKALAAEFKRLQEAHQAANPTATPAEPHTLRQADYIDTHKPSWASQTIGEMRAGQKYVRNPANKRQGEANIAKAVEDAKNTHRDAVQKALSEGKAVPKEVADDYPQLGQKEDTK